MRFITLTALTAAAWVTGHLLLPPAAQDAWDSIGIALLAGFGLIVYGRMVRADERRRFDPTVLDQAADLIEEVASGGVRDDTYRAGMKAAVGWLRLLADPARTAALRRRLDHAHQPPTEEGRLMVVHSANGSQ